MNHFRTFVFLVVALLLYLYVWPVWAATFDEEIVGFTPRAQGICRLPSGVFNCIRAESRDGKTIFVIYGEDQLPFAIMDETGKRIWSK